MTASCSWTEHPKQGNPWINKKKDFKLGQSGWWAEQSVTSNETAEVSRVHTMQDTVGHVKFCLYPKSNRKSWKIFKQVIGRGGRKRTWLDLHFEKITLHSVKKRLYVGGGKEDNILGCRVSVKQYGEYCNNPSEMMVAWSKGVEMEKKMDRLPIYLDK